MVESECPICSVNVPGGMKELGQHLKSTHSIPLSKSLDRPLQCMRCSAAFGDFQKYSRHFIRFHAFLVEAAEVSNAASTSNVQEGLSQASSSVENVSYRGSSASTCDRVCQVTYMEEDEPYLTREYECVDCCDEEDEEDEEETDDSQCDGNNEPFIDWNEGLTIDMKIRMCAAEMIRDLLAKPNTTHALVRQVIDSFQNLLSVVCQKFKEEATIFLGSQNVSEVAAEPFLSKFDSCDPFHKMKTWKGQETALKQYFGYVKPTDVQLGIRFDQVLTHDDDGMCQYIQKPVRDTLQYVSVIETIRTALTPKEIRDFIYNENESEEGILASYKDGEQFKNCEFFKKHPRAIRLQVFGDDIEIANGMGSKKSIHKLLHMAVSLQNIPAELNSALANIHLLILAFSQDVKKYKYKKILEAFLDDLRKLESDEGVVMNFDGKDYIVHAVLTSVVADTLAAHELLGFISPGGAKCFCRLCMITREELHHGVSMGEKRTVELHTQHLEKLSSDRNFTSTDCGVEVDSPLNSCRIFHCTTNYNFDPMHEYLEGLSPMIVKLVLKTYIIDKKYFTVKDVNEWLKSYDYGHTERRNRPTPNFDREKLKESSTNHKLDQNSSQMWLLSRVFPFVFQHKVPKDDPYMALILNLLNVMDMVFAPRMHKKFLPLLDSYVADLKSRFVTLYPDVSLINKFHHIEHLVENIRQSSTMLLYSCMRYEGKHHCMKCRGSCCCNFRNIAKTVARTCQIYSCKSWCGPEPEVLQKVKALSGQQVKPQSMQSFPLMDKSDATKAEVFSAQTVSVFGIEYRKGLFVIVEGNGFSEKEPEFGLIKEIIVEGDEVKLFVQVWNTLFEHPDFNAYQVEEKTDYKIISVDSLVYKSTLSLWRDLGQGRKFVRPRSIIF